jgi:predicted MFS family arabinose efflux permease
MFLVSLNWGFVLYAVSSSIPQLATDLGVSKAVSGAHGAMLSAGSVAVGLFLTPIVSRLGRGRAIAGALAVAGVSCACFVAAPTAAVTLPAAIVMAAAYTMATALANATLVAQQGPAAAATVSVSCSVGSAMGCVSPLVVGFATVVGWGWRPAVAVAVPLTLVTSLIVARLPKSPELGSALAASGAATPPGGANPPCEDVTVITTPRSMRLFVIFTALTAAGVMLEMGVVFWSAQLLVDQMGFSAGGAAAASMAFMVGLTSGRLVTGPVSLRHSPLALLMLGLVTIAAGWAVLWTTTDPVVAMAALVVMGMGAGPGYPFGVALTLSHSPFGLEASQSVQMVAGGAAGAVAPFAMGWLGDRVGVHAAFTVTPCLVAAELALAALGGLALRKVRLRRRSES